MTLREVGTVCVAPVLMAGYMVSTNLPLDRATKYENTVGNAAIVSIQTCDRGWGINAKATTSGLYGSEVQYAFKFEPTPAYSVTLSPRLGVSYVDHPVVQLPQRTQFGLGGQVMFGYEDFRVGVEFWHLSNGSALGLNVSDRPNIGMNMVTIQTGWVF